MICAICEKEYDGQTTSKTCSIKCRKEYLKRYRREYYRKYTKTTKSREYRRKYREKNKEKINEYNREWHRNNPEKGKQYDKKHSRKKALSKYTEGQISKFEELAFRQQFLDDYNREGKCIICEKAGVMILHHVKYNPQETVLMCPKCHSRLHKRFLNGEKCKPY